MTLKINIDKLKKKLEEQKSSTTKTSTGDFVKAEGPGVLDFRAVMYPHTDDPTSEPFIERHYHWGLVRGALYCPKENENKECHVCNHVWKMMTKHKGNKEEINKWRKYLPKMAVLVAGFLRDDEEKTPKFFRLNTDKREDRRHPVHSKLWKWSLSEDTCQWMDPEVGFDMELTYVSPTEAQKKLFKTSVFFEDADLKRTASPFGTKKEYENFMASVKNIDEDIYPRKTTEDTLDALAKLHERLAPLEAMKATDEDLNSSSEDMSTQGADDDFDLDKKLSEMGLD